MAGIKIVDLPALGRDLAATDLLELSLAGGTGSRKITGQEIMNASKLSVGNTPIINGAVGQVLFQGTGNVLQESANLSWDNTNARLRVNGAVIAGNGLCSLSNGTGNYGQVGSNYYYDGSTPRRWGNDHAAQIDFGLGFRFRVAGNGASGSAISWSELGYWNASTGNLLVGTTTDAGFKLDVNGATRIKGTGTTSSTTAFTVQNSAGTTYFSIKDDGALSSSGTDTGIYSNFTTGNKSPLLFSHSGYGTNTPNDTRIDFGYRGRQAGGLNSYDFFTYKVYQGADPTVTTGFEFYTHQNQASSLASQLAMAINGSNVGIGTSSPANKLDIKGTGDVVLIDSNAVASRVTLKLNTTSASYTQIIGNGTELNLATLGSTHITFATNSSERVRIGSTTGNVLINTTTDAGFRLDVNGTSRLNGSLTLGNGLIFNLDGSTTRIFNSSQINYQSNLISGTQHNFTNQVGYNTGTIMSIYAGGSANPSTSGTMAIQSISGRMSFASGNATYNAVQVATNVENSGTYNGTIRGFYYNPSLLGTGYSHFAFHSTSGRVRFEGLPTSPTGLNAGDLWNDAGTLKIV